MDRADIISPGSAGFILHRIPLYVPAKPTTEDTGFTENTEGPIPLRELGDFA